MIQQIRLVALIPQAVKKWSKRPEKDDRERKVQSIHFAHFLPLPFAGMLAVSWHWQGQYKPLTGSPFRAAFSRYKAPQNHKAGLNISFVLVLYVSDSLNHTHRHTVELVKKKKKGRKFVQWESRETKAFCLPCPYFVLKILDKPPKMIAYGERCWIWISEGENLASGPETWLQALRVSCGKSFITVKTGKSFWHRHQVESAPLTSLMKALYTFSIGY